MEPGPVVDMINETNEGDLSDSGELRIRLERLRRQVTLHRRPGASQAFAIRAGWSCAGQPVSTAQGARFRETR